MSPENVICLGTVLFLVFWMVALRIGLRREAVLTARLAVITAQEPPLLTLDERALRWQSAQIGQRESRRQRGILLMTPTALRLYGRTPELPEMLAIRPDQLRWFGRSHKYTSGMNEIWLHIETETGWQLLKIRLHQQAMQQLVRALKSFAAPELVEAYRRRRPYIHSGPMLAAP
ncbi:MAG TPA: hypothetical protein VHO69_14605, partial [Phototrophicaceae bacterium]|nr:hypothetical protein [Phototrophicaceae bacterium]